MDIHRRCRVGSARRGEWFGVKDGSALLEATPLVDVYIHTCEGEARVYRGVITRVVRMGYVQAMPSIRFGSASREVRGERWM